MVSVLILFCQDGAGYNKIFVQHFIILLIMYNLFIISFSCVISYSLKKH